MGMGFAPTWLRQVSPPASKNHFNYWTPPFVVAMEEVSAVYGLWRLRADDDDDCRTAPL